MAKTLDKWQYGDFQTPLPLAEAVMNKLVDVHCLAPDTIVEPSCGKGAFVIAAARKLPKANIFGMDVNPDYIRQAQTNLEGIVRLGNVFLQQGDFFETQWNSVLPEQESNLLILGNPPWVTASELGALNSKNLPEKTNFQNSRGIEAITGSSNFDISEWMLLQYIDWLRSTSNLGSALAVLCKTSVARKVFRSTINFTESYRSHIYPIDAKKLFGASVEACLFVLSRSNDGSSCSVYQSFDSDKEIYRIGLREGRIVRNLRYYDKWKKLSGMDARYIWRSGVKHDCSKVMELSKCEGSLVNGLGEQVEIEDTYVYPLFKSSDVANGRIAQVRKYVVITQSYVGEETDKIRKLAPATWKYLEAHSSKLDSRTSAVYRGRPRFSIFGVGDYTFGKWKVAISGFYKKLYFELVPPCDGRPVAFDDTVYFLSFSREDEARFIYEILNSAPALEFLDSLIFWDEKRPITAKILRALNLRELAKRLDRESEYFDYAEQSDQNQHGQLELGIAEHKAGYSVAVTT